MIDPRNYYCDAALIGFPGTGKSTLFNTLTGRTDSRKMPRFEKISEDLCGQKEFILADIGGISRGAVKNGLHPGAQWLAYTESCQTLVYILSFKNAKINLARLASDFSFLVEAVSLYKNNFHKNKKHIAVINLFDNIDVNTFRIFKNNFPQEKIFIVNALQGTGISSFIKKTVEAYVEVENSVQREA